VASTAAGLEAATREPVSHSRGRRSSPAEPQPGRPDPQEKVTYGPVGRSVRTAAPSNLGLSECAVTSVASTSMTSGRAASIP
jgi:hypothetical protein